MIIKPNLKSDIAILKSVFSLLSKDKQVRKSVVTQDILWFFRLYFPHYITYPIADFQVEILGLLQEEKNKMLAIVSFRDSGKSTFCSLLLPIWSIVCEHRKKYILLVCQTEQKAQQALRNIRSALEAPGMLMDDFGAFCEDDEWNKNTLVIPKYGVRITAVSIGEKIRGLIHIQNRPDLIICDDLEDVQSAKTQEGRDKLWEFVNGELIPAGSRDARKIFIGNLVHEDSLMNRLIQRIDDKKLTGIRRVFPLVNKEGEILWPGKFMDMKSIEALKKRLPSEIDYLREYLLKIVPPGSRIIYPEDIHRYDEAELKARADFLYYLILMDSAVSEEKNADNTAIYVIKVYGRSDKLTYYIMPHPVNEKLTWPNIIEKIREIVASLGPYPLYRIFVEGGGQQKALTQILVHEGFNAEEVSPQGNSKQVRLSILKKPMQDGVILFPKSGIEESESQILGFGTKEHDDLVDALTLLSLKMPELSSELGSEVISISAKGFYEGRRHGFASDDDDDDDWGDSAGNGFPRIGRPSSWRNILPG